MNIVFFLLPLALCLALFFIYGFIKATKSGQYDDMDTPAHRMLLEDD